MQYRKLKIDLLEAKHSMKILIALRENDSIPRSVLYGLVSTSPTSALNRTNELIEAGLISESIMNHQPFTKIVSLTEQGKRIADYIAEVEEILRE